jgi:hypothetical protein
MGIQEVDKHMGPWASSAGTNQAIMMKSKPEFSKL